MLVQALGGGDLPVVALLACGVRVIVTSKKEVRALAATAGARLPDVTAVAQMAGAVRFLSERMNAQEGYDERVCLLLIRRRQVLEMQAQEGERQRVAEYPLIREDLERHLFFLDRLLARLHELLLYAVRVVHTR